MLGFDLDLGGFPAATRYVRSLPTFSDVSIKPSFLRTTAAKKPRTECCCHPVAFMIAAIVAPLGCLRSPTTVSCLVSLWVEPEPTFSSFAGFFARLAGAIFALLGVLRGDILEILLGCGGISAVTTEAPQWRYRQRGRDLRRGQKARINATTLTLCLRRKSSRFCKEYRGSSGLLPPWR